MLRNAYTFVCTLFALVFLFGFQSASHASRVQAAGGFLAGDNTYVALYITGNDANASGQVSLTTGDAHFYGSLDSLSVSNTQIVMHATSLDGFTLITGTLTRPNASAAWAVHYEVTIPFLLNVTFNSTLKGSVIIR